MAHPIKTDYPYDTDTLFDMLGQVHEYFWTKFGRDGGNGKGGLSDGKVAAWDRTRGLVYMEDTGWDCVNVGTANFNKDSISFCGGTLVPDVLGHEFAHAITYYRFDGHDNLNSMVYESESGSLQENYSDFAGEAYELYVSGSTDWLFGGTLAKSPPYRNLADPEDCADCRTALAPTATFIPSSTAARITTGACTITPTCRTKRPISWRWAARSTATRSIRWASRRSSRFFTERQRSITRRPRRSTVPTRSGYRPPRTCTAMRMRLRSAKRSKPWRWTTPDRARAIRSLSAEVVDRHVFYNQSAFDGNDPAATAADDKAIAPEKDALLPGQRASLRNYTNYNRGINGVMVDVAHLKDPAAITAADFEFRVGNSDDFSSWQPGPAPTNVWTRAKEGRIAITWADAAITKKWLEIRVKANDRTGLLQDDVFYFGNAVGESGDSANNTLVNEADVSGARNNPHDPSNPALINDVFDYNRDSLVNDADEAVARENATDPATSLVLLNLGGGTAPTVTVNSLTTNDRTPIISGTVSAGTLHVSVNGKTYTKEGANLTVNGTDWVLEVPASDALTDGVYSVTATATDSTGNVGIDETTNELTVDVTAPVLVVSALLTNISKPTLAGTVSDPSPSSGVTGVSVVVGGQVLAAVISGGNWSVTVPATLADGTHDVQVTATDAAGNIGSDATTGELVVDTTPPGTPVVTGISDDTGVSQQDGVTSNATLVVRGTSEAETVVEIFLGATSIGTATVDAAGSWIFDHTSTAHRPGPPRFCS